MMKAFEKIKEKLEIIYIDYEYEENSGFIEMCIDAVNQVAEEEEREENYNANIILDILNKFEMFQGQRAGRELWADKAKEIQDKDIESFNKDLQTIRSYIERRLL